MDAQDLQIDSGKPALRLLVLTDGRAGNEAQALGLAEALARRRPTRIAVERRALAGPRSWPPPRLWHALARLAPGAVGRLFGGMPGPADLIIGAGRRVAPLVALAGRRGHVPTVQLLDPRMPVGAFSLVVAPEHDGLRGEGVLSTLGAIGRVTPERIAAAAAGWADRLTALPPPRLAVLIGGPGRMARWGPGDGEALARALAGLAKDGWSLMVTASRRTPPALVERLGAQIDLARHLLHAGQGDNPYPAILGHADAVLVTADSVNMVSEGASSGLPVHVFEVGGLAPKARSFHVRLAEGGFARPFEGRIERWSPPRLAEADRIAAEIEARLFPPG